MEFQTDKFLEQLSKDANSSSFSDQGYGWGKLVDKDMVRHDEINSLMPPTSGQQKAGKSFIGGGVFSNAKIQGAGQQSQSQDIAYSWGQLLDKEMARLDIVDSLMPPQRANNSKTAGTVGSLLNPVYQEKQIFPEKNNKVTQQPYYSQVTDYSSKQNYTTQTIKQENNQITDEEIQFMSELENYEAYLIKQDTYTEEEIATLVSIKAVVGFDDDEKYPEAIIVNGIIFSEDIMDN